MLSLPLIGLAIITLPLLAISVDPLIVLLRDYRRTAHIWETLATSEWGQEYPAPQVVYGGVIARMGVSEPAWVRRETMTAIGSRTFVGIEQ